MISRGRYVILIALYAAYAMHTYARRSFQNIINYTLKEHFLTADVIGIIITAQQIGYTMCKFVQPFIVDHINPRISLVMTMIMSFVCLFSMSYSTSTLALILFYWLHGFCLGFAWPSVAKILKMIIVESEFGLWWSILCTSSNTGAIIGSVVSTCISNNYGWRMNLKFSATINLIFGFLIAANFMIFSILSPRVSRAAISNQSYGSCKIKVILLNPLLISNGILIFTIYVSRYVISDWYQIYLSYLGFTQITIASFISMMEIGGIVGTVIAGIMADFFYVHFEDWKNPRVMVLIIFSSLTASVQHLLIFVVSKDTIPFNLTLFGFFFGTFIYGPVAVSGIVSIEAVPLEQQGLSFSINIIYANVAMLVAGYPLSYIGQIFGWHTVFIISYIGVCLSTTLIILLRHFPSPLDIAEKELQEFTN